MTTIFVADTSDMKAGLKGLTGAERELAQAEIEAAEARNKHLEDWKQGLEHVVIGVAALGEAAHLAFEGYQEGLKESRLETAAMGTDIDALSKAAGGLQTHMQLLEFAAKVQTSAFGATNEQMETAERFMRMLEARGVPTADAYNAVTEAITTGRVKGLIPYGVVINTHLDDLSKLGEENLTLAQKAELVTGAYKAMADATSGVVDGNDNVGDSMKRTGVELADTWADFKKQLGELVVAFQPVIEVLNEVLKGINAIIGANVDEWLSKTDPLGVARQMIYGGQGGGNGLTGVGTRGRLGAGVQETAFDRAIKGFQTYQQGLVEEASKEFQFADDHVDSWNTHRQHIKDGMNQWLSHAIDGGLKELGSLTDRAQSEIHALRVEGATSKDFADKRDLNTKTLGAWGIDINAQLDGMKSGSDPGTQRQTQLSKIFGPISDFELYKKGFDTLTGAVGTAYEAWVSGSESAGTAVKKFLGEMIMGFGKQMAVESIKYGAYALASLVPGPFFDPAAAAGYGATAAAFAGGAVIAGIAAHELGAGGGSTPAKSAGGSSSAGSGSITGPSGGKGSGGGNTIVVGEIFNDDTPRMRQNKARRWVALANGNSGYEDS